MLEQTLQLHGKASVEQPQLALHDHFASRQIAVLLELKVRVFDPELVLSAGEQGQIELVQV